MKGTDMRLLGRSALVTGASSGIGAGIALAFAKEGCDIAVVHLGDEKGAASVSTQISEAGRKVVTIDCDVADEMAWEAAHRSAKAALGQFDILVTAAGMSADLSFDEITPALWDRMIAVHLKGTYLATRSCYPDMRRRKWGRIITIASQHGLKGSARKVHYSAAKAGIIGFTKALAREAAPHGVLVNCIAPGPVETPLLNALPEDWRRERRAELPLGRFGRVDEIVPTALMLASDDGGFYVGQTLSPNGGDIMLP